MPWKGFASGVVLGALLTVAGGGALQLRAAAKGPPLDRSITFSDKLYFDTAEVPALAPLGAGSVRISGSLVGDDTHANNTTSILCTQAEMRCDVATATQIGPHQVAAITIDNFPITQWSPDLIVATTDDQCTTTTLNILRRSHSASYVTVPHSSVRTSLCDQMPTRRTTVERSAFWRSVSKLGETAAAG